MAEAHISITVNGEAKEVVSMASCETSTRLCTMATTSNP